MVSFFKHDAMITEATDSKSDSKSIAIDTDPVNFSSQVSMLERGILESLHYIQCKSRDLATKNDWYMAVAYTVRSRLMNNWIDTLRGHADKKSKVVGYLSAEFLVGPHLGNAMINLGIYEQVKEATARLGFDLRQLMDMEEEPGLGNGGLGRLAACFLDSLTTLKVPAIGYGIRYEFGIFEQQIRDGWQFEVTDKWLRLGNPWEIARPELTFRVKMGGHTEHYSDEKGVFRIRWIPELEVKGVAYDTPVPGYLNNKVNLLRLWKSEAVESFDFEAFNRGDYQKAVDEKVYSENIGKVLYPNDEPAAGKKLRLSQQYFFVSCSIQDILRLFETRGLPMDELPDSLALHVGRHRPRDLKLWVRNHRTPIAKQEKMLRLRIHLETWTSRAQPGFGAVHALATGVLGDIQDRRRFGMAVIEHFVQQEGGAFFRPEPFQQQQEGECQGLAAFQRRIRCLGDFARRLRQPWAEVVLALGFRATQTIQRQPGRNRNQPRFRVVQRGCVLRMPAQPRVVQHVLGIGRGAEHAVGQPEQAWTVLLKEINGRHGAIPVRGMDRTRSRFDP